MIGANTRYTEAINTMIGTNMGHCKEKYSGEIELRVQGKSCALLLK